MGSPEQNLIDWTPTDFIRFAEPKDIEPIAEMCQQFEGTDSPEMTAEAVRETLKDFVVEGDPPVGFIRGNVVGDSLLLTLIVVRADVRRAGVGTRLLKAAEGLAEGLGLRGVVNCGPKTPEVSNLYAKLGYEEIDRIPGHWGPKGDAVILYKTVGETKHVDLTQTPAK